jgi:hypothetical protein
VRHQQRKQKRSAPRVTKVGGKVVALARRGAALPADSDVWLPAPKIRRLLGGISPVTFWRWRHNPRLGFPPGRRINNRWYFSRAAVCAWHEKQSVTVEAA